MKFTFAALLLFVICLSCEKTNEPLPPTPETPSDSLAPERQISLAYLYSMSETNQFELIITDSSANFLLDTIISPNDMHFLKLYSRETSFNITTIDLKESTNRINVQTFYQVTPNQWKINQSFNIGFNDDSPQEPKVDGELFYYNIPKNTQDGKFQYGNGYYGSFDLINKKLSVGYLRKLPYNSFILFTTPGLYKFYETHKQKDSVDLSLMDTAVTKVFQKSFPMSSSVRQVTGFTRKDDNSSAILLWNNSFEPKLSTYDIMYPPTGVEQYQVLYIAIDQNQKWHETQLFGETIPNSIDFIDSSWYSIVNNNINDFKVSFPKTQPSLYSLKLIGNKFDWRINLPPQKNKLKGIGEIIDLTKSIRFKNHDYPSLEYDGIELFNGDNLSYKDYFNFIFAKDASGKNKFSIFMSF